MRKTSLSDIDNAKRGLAVFCDLLVAGEALRRCIAAHGTLRSYLYQSRVE